MKIIMYQKTINIPDHFFNEVEKLMFADGYMEQLEEEYGTKPTESEWKEEVIETCIYVIRYMECNASIRDAYMDFMH